MPIDGYIFVLSSPVTEHSDWDNSGFCYHLKNEFEEVHKKSSSWLVNFQKSQCDKKHLEYLLCLYSWGLTLQELRDGDFKIGINNSHNIYYKVWQDLW